MAGSWTSGSLGDFIELKRGYDLSSVVRKAGNVPIVSSGGRSGFHDVAMVKGPSVVTGRYGTIGKVMYVSEDFWPLNTTLYVSDFKGSHPRFVSYLLETVNFSAYSDKAAVPVINRNRLHEAVVTWPEYQEQKAIARILGSLDDKIDLNRQMSETLEEMAQALFESWFVNFDPVCAKAKGRASGLPDDIAVLFPDRFDDGGLPEGWHHEPLLTFATLISGGTPKTDEPLYWEGSIPWASAKDVSQCPTQFLLSTERAITDRGLEESSTKLIPAYSTVVVARGATTGRHCITGIEMAMNQTCYALNANNGHNFWFSCAFSNSIQKIVQSAHGSIFDTITTTTLKNTDLVAGSKI